jgi:hypothetical protein
MERRFSATKVVPRIDEVLADTPGQSFSSLPGRQHDER